MQTRKPSRRAHRRHRLWQPGARACAEPARQRLSRWSSDCDRTARLRHEREPTDSRCARPRKRRGRRARRDPDAGHEPSRAVRADRALFCRRGPRCCSRTASASTTGACNRTRRRHRAGRTESRRAISCVASTRPGRACPACSRWPRMRPAAQGTGARLCARDRRHAQRRARNDLRRRDRDGPFRRAGRALRRRDRAGRQGLRDAGRSRLSARGRVLRVPARAEADRRPAVRGRARQDAPVRRARRRSTAT